MKTILISLANLNNYKSSMEAAIFLARAYDSHIIGYYPVPGSALIVYMAPGAPVPVDDTMKRAYENKRDEVKADFEDRMRRAGVKYEWREEKLPSVQVTNALLRQARESELIILAHDGPDKPHTHDETSFVAGVVLEAGRPVLVMPPSDEEDFSLKKVAVGWNASREASRAVFDSLNFMKLADEVNLLWVNPDSRADMAGDLPGSELAATLARHDIQVSSKGISNQVRTSRAIANFCTDEAVDLLVMGAYGHSRLREQILGGVTEYTLNHLPCPVLLSN